MGLRMRAVGRVTAATLAMAFLQVWTDLLGHSSAFAQQMDPIWESTMLVRYAGMAVGAVLFTLLAKRCDNLKNGIVALMGGAGCAASVVCAVAPTSIAEPALCTTGFIHIVLSSYTLFLVCQLNRLETAILAAIAAFTIKGCIPSLIEMLPFDPLPVICSIPLLSAICYLVANMLNIPEETASTCAPTMLRGDRTSVVMLVFGISAGVICAVARNDTSMSYWGSASSVLIQTPAIGFIGALVYMAAAYATFVHTAHDPVRRFIPSLTALVILFGILRFGVLNAVVTPYGSALFETYAEQYSHLFYIVVVITCTRHVKMAAATVVGVMQTAFSVTYLVMNCLGPYQSLSFGVILLLCALLYLFVFITRDAYEHDLLDAVNEASSSAPTTQVDHKLEDTVKELANRYGLSERECVVLTLLAQGRSRKVIGDELHLAYGTVGSYTARIYEKMRVHSKQEALSIVYEELGQ